MTPKAKSKELTLKYGKRINAVKSARRKAKPVSFRLDQDSWRDDLITLVAVVIWNGTLRIEVTGTKEDPIVIDISIEDATRFFRFARKAEIEIEARRKTEKDSRAQINAIYKEWDSEKRQQDRFYDSVWNAGRFLKEQRFKYTNRTGAQIIEEAKKKWGDKVVSVALKDLSRWG